MASSPAAVVGAVRPDATVAAKRVVPPAALIRSMALAPGAVESPEYSMATTPMSAVPLAETEMTGSLASPRLSGAVHTLVSAPSAATPRRSSVKWSPEESDIPVVLASPPHIDAITIRRSPEVTGERNRTARFPVVSAYAEVSWTKWGLGVAVGVTGLEGRDAGPRPEVFAALTVNR